MEENEILFTAKTDKKTYFIFGKICGEYENYQQRLTQTSSAAILFD